MFSCQLFADQDPYDFIDPNPDEEATLSEGDLQHNAPYVSCIKVCINIHTDPYSVLVFLNPNLSGKDTTSMHMCT